VPGREPWEQPRRGVGSRRYCVLCGLRRPSLHEVRGREQRLLRGGRRAAALEQSALVWGYWHPLPREEHARRECFGISTGRPPWLDPCAIANNGHAVTNADTGTDPCDDNNDGGFDDCHAPRVVERIRRRRQSMPWCSV